MAFAKYKNEDEKGQKPGGQDKFMPFSLRDLLLAKAIEQPNTRGPGTQWGLPGTAEGGDIGCLGVSKASTACDLEC